VRIGSGSNFSEKSVKYATVEKAFGRSAIERLPVEPLFVDRESELAAFDEVLRLLDQGVRRHTALLGLRRIGKTLLLDQVRRRYSTVAISRLEVDAVVTTPEDFARAWMSETLVAVLRARVDETYVGETDDALHAAAVGLHPKLEPIVTELLEHIHSEAHGRLLNQALRLPAEVSETTSTPLLVMLDEFQ